MENNAKTQHNATQYTLLRIERLTMLWWIFTTILVISFWHLLADPLDMMLTHLFIAICISSSWFLGSHLQNYLDHHCTPRLRRLRLDGIGTLIRVAAPLAMLALWYGETYSFCSLQPYKDHWFAAADQWLCGCQPSLLFSEALKNGCLGLPEALFSEAFNMGYWSYFAMQLVIMLYYYFAHRDEMDRVATTILAAFFIFYTIYFMLPVGGPQYYFAAIGIHNASSAIFPDMGNYLATHTDMLPAPGWSGGLFYNLVASAQDTGEFPTAAFPSSHVGCTVVFLSLALRRSQRLFLCLLPFATLLICATVYIQAHYLIDVIAGALAGLLIYRLLKTRLLD